MLADVVIFFLSVTAGQLVSLKILTREKIANLFAQYLSMAGIIAAIVAFMFLSYYPPKNFFFRDPESSEYGILDHYHHHDH